MTDKTIIYVPGGKNRSESVKTFGIFNTMKEAKACVDALIAEGRGLETMWIEKKMIIRNG